MKSFDKVIAAKMRDELNAVLVAVGKKYDVDVHVGNCSFTDTEMTYKLHVKTNDVGVIEAREKEEWNKYCELYGFEKEDLGKEFTISGNKKYTIDGFALNRSKFNLKATSLKDGKKVLFSSGDISKKLHPTKAMHKEFGLGGTYACKYCGKDNNSKNADKLCKDCQDTFGHTYYSEL